MSDAILKAALADTAVELALVKAELEALRKSSAALEATVKAKNAEIVTLVKAKDQAEHRAGVFAAVLSRAGFDASEVERNGLWAVAAMDHLRCTVLPYEFVGPTMPGDPAGIHALTARNLIA